MLYSYSDYISKTSHTSLLTNTGTKFEENLWVKNPEHKVGRRTVSALEVGDHYLSGCKACYCMAEQGLHQSVLTITMRQVSRRA